MSAEPRAFVDTNILVYAHDTTAGEKRDAAAAIVTELWESRRGCLSVQVLQELYVTLTRKLPKPLGSQRAVGVLEDFAQWRVHAPAADDVVAAAWLQERFTLSFWDAMILRSATELGCGILYSEDLNAGQRYEGVLVVDPFA